MKFNLKLNKKIVIPVVSLAVAGALAIILVPKIASGANAQIPTVSASPLEKRNLSNTVSVTGTVKSDKDTKVYSTLTYQVKNINVEVGDFVKSGDVLCELDTSDLVTKIEQETASLTQSQEKAQHSLAVAQKDLATEKFNQEKNYDPQLASAEKAVETAEQGLLAAKSKLEDAKSGLDASKLSLRSAQQDLTYKRKVLGDYRDTNDINPDYFEPDFESKLKAVRDAELTLEQRSKDVDDAERGVEDAERAVDEAKTAISDAKASLNTVKVQKQEAIISQQDKVTSAQLGADLSDQWMRVEDLKKDLDESIITAPASGTITAVLAVEGTSGQGLLFVIEDTSKLKVDTKVKEYDIAGVSEGQAVKIKSDGTGDEEYAGKVSKIAPTAIKNDYGGTIETTDVEFATEVAVTGTSKLKIGMNARLDIITDEKSDVFAVPFDAVVQNANGEDVVYVARPAPNAGIPDDKGQAAPDGDDVPASGGTGGGFKLSFGKKNESQTAPMVATAIPVQTGLETDLYIEIISASLREGDLIISNAADITDGQTVTLGDDGFNMQGGVRGGPGGGPGEIRIGG